MKGAGRGKGKGKGKGRGSKRSPEERAAERGTKRKAEDDSSDEDEEKGADKKKGARPLTEKRKRRKEVTKLYGELINPGRERKAEVVVGELLELLKQRKDGLEEYCSKELGSRVVQALLKWGTIKQRRAVLLALKEHIPKLAVDRYGHVVVLKLLAYVSRTSKERKPSDEEKKAQTQNLRDLMESFRGKNLHSIFYHRHGCKIVNAIYFSESVKTTEKRRLFHEVAVPVSVAMRRSELPGSKTLRELITATDLSADQRQAMLSHLREAVEKAVDKELLGYNIVHLMYQVYCEHASEAQLKDLAEKCMPGAPYLLSSKPGAEAMLRLLGVVSAKDRKTLLKDLKGKFPALAMNSVDYLVMMRICSTVDDTVLLGKTMLAEWAEEMEELCFDKYGHRVLAWLFCPGDKHLFSPYELQSLALPAPTSIKEPEKRRQELVRQLRPLVRKVLLAAPLKAAADVCAKDLLIASLSQDWDAEVVEALLNDSAKAADDKQMGFLNSGTAVTALLVLLKLEPADGSCPLALPLWRRVLEPHLEQAVTSRCAFVILALLKKGGEVGEAVLKTLRSKRKKVEEALKASKAKGVEVKGAQQLLDAVDKPLAK